MEDPSQPGGPQKATAMVSTKGEIITEDSFSSRQPYELKWANYQPYLLEKGYQLRPRYRPDWTPSWKSSGAFPPDCEDSWAALSINEIDAIYIVDQRLVSIKIMSNSTGGEEGTQEIEILRHLAQPHLRSNAENHAIPLLDIFHVPDNPQSVFIVTPYFPSWKTIPLLRFSEVMDFMQQNLEGIRFLHCENIAHRDAVALNIVMDATSLYSEPFHPANPAFSLDGQRRVMVKPRSEGTVRYYFVGFHLSTRYSSRDARRLVTGWQGLERRAPELSYGRTPYDPFRLDVLTIGLVIGDEVLKKYRGFDKLRPMVEAMIARDPKQRPTIDEVLDRYMVWAQAQGPITRAWRLVPLHAGLFRRMLIALPCLVELFVFHLKGFITKFWRLVGELGWK